ncbi:MAG: DUF4833 domain-containing protein [Bacteroidetes bacterium]|nr:DUF4833 domain-containing protein [Bacteroidota bacterium]
MKSVFFTLFIIPLFVGNFFIPFELGTNTNTKDIPSGMKKNNQALFYIERSKNKNRVYYDANFDINGIINAEKPIDVYWLNLEENYGKRGELSFIQEKMAYGYRSGKISERTFEIKLKAFSKRPLIVLVDITGKAKAQIKIQGKQAILHHLFIKATDKGIVTTVQYIELFGIDIYTKTELYEKIII